MRAWMTSTSSSRSSKIALAVLLEGRVLLGGLVLGHGRKLRGPTVTPPGLIVDRCEAVAELVRRVGRAVGRRQVLAAGAGLVRHARSPSPPRPRQGWPAIAVGRAHADPRPHRLGQDAGRLPVGHRPAGHHAAARRQGAAHPPALPLAAAGAGRRRREEPARAARGHRRWPPSGSGVAVPRADRRHAHRRHRRPTSAGSSSATRPTCSSPRPSRSTSCSRRRRATRCATSRR